MMAGVLPEETLRRAAAWAEDAGCRLLVLFGSAADPATLRVEDVDLALDLPRLPAPERHLLMVGELQDRFGTRPVDVVFLHRDTDPVLRFEVFRRGIPLYEATPGLFLHEVVRALSLYEDALPFRRALEASLRDGAP
jgi:hypothetical protein